jgi:hypothetical protein
MSFCRVFAANWERFLTAPLRALSTTGLFAAMILSLAVRAHRNLADSCLSLSRTATCRPPEVSGTSIATVAQ